MSGNGLQSKWSVLTINRHIINMIGRKGHFQVLGLGRRVSGSGIQVQVQVPGLITEPVPEPVPVAETRHP